jgi:hypothetical protein
MSANPFDRLVHLATHRLGIRVITSHPSNGDKELRARFSWNGHNLLLDEYNDTVSACHEVAHYIVAEPWQRHIPDYALGRGPFSYRGRDAQILMKAEKLFRHSDQNFVDEQEAQAAILTYFLAVEVQVPLDEMVRDAELNGVRWRAQSRYSLELKGYDHSKDHLYDPYELRSFFSTIVELEALGLLHEQKPTYRLNRHVRSPLDPNP